MIQKFFGVPIYRVDNLSDMFFTIQDMAKTLGVKDKTIRRMINQCNEARVLSLPRGKTGVRKELRNIYTLKTCISLLFATHHEYTSEKNTKIREWITTILNNLCFDEFVSLYGYRLDEDLRRAIASHVCKTKSYKEIVMTRFNILEDYCNTVLRGNMSSKILYAKNPEAYINRYEVLQIKAIDLAVYLLCEYAVEDTPKEFLKKIGIEVKKGRFTEKDQEDILNFLSKYYKNGILRRKKEFK